MTFVVSSYKAPLLSKSGGNGESRDPEGTRGICRALRTNFTG